MHCSLAGWVVIIVYSSATGVARHITAGIRLRLLIRRGEVVVSLLRGVGQTWLLHNLIALFIGEVVRCFTSQWFVFRESRKAALLAILLFGLTICFGFDGVHPYLIRVLIMTRLEIPRTTPLAFPGWPAAQTTSPTTKEDTTEEEEDPGDDGKPYGVTDCSAAARAVNPGFCQEEERKVEDESDHSHSCGEAGNTGAAACHGHFSDMGQETEHSRSCGQDECDDVKYEAVRDPFDNDVGKLDPGVVSE